MKIVSMLQLRDCVGRIDKMLTQVSNVSDEIVILDHASIDDTGIKAKAYPKVKIVLQEDNPNWAEVEMKNKQRLLESALALNPDWLFWLDSDELISKPLLEKLRKLPEENPTVIMFGFAEINFWNSEKQYRTDSGWYPAWTQRLIKANPFLHYTQRIGIGPKNSFVPEGIRINKGETLLIEDLPILHYGYIDQEMRTRKYNKYIELDNDFEYIKLERYKRIIDESKLELKNTKTEWL